MTKLDSYRYDGTKKLDLSKICHDSSGMEAKKDSLLKKTEKNLLEIAELQEKLYADSRESVVLVLQAMDAAGKDSTIKHVMSCVNPQGVDVFSFKTPTTTEAAHDFLWRYHRCLPVRGKMGIFNRSYYEEVLVVKVHQLQKTYRMPDRTIKEGDYFKQKYKEITAWESYLYGNGYRLVKIFLNVSKDEQKKRFLERIEKPEKNWKFSSSDLKERAFWDDYQKAYEDAINGTSTADNPWYVLPADQKWYTRYLVSEILVQTLRSVDPRFPEMTKEAKAGLAECKKQLTEEK